MQFSNCHWSCTETTTRPTQRKQWDSSNSIPLPSGFEWCWLAGPTVVCLRFNPLPSILNSNMELTLTESRLSQRHGTGHCLCPTTFYGTHTLLMLLCPALVSRPFLRWEVSKGVTAKV